MKKTLALLLTLVLSLGCAALAAETVETAAPAPEATETAASSRHILVAYFSRVGNTDFPEDVDASSSASIVVTEEGEIMGNLGFMAEEIASQTGGDLFLIQTVETYPASYDETLDVASDEQAGNARPELAVGVENLGQYDTVFLGFPNWWGGLPMAVYTFLEENDLSGKTVIPFTSSGGGSFARAQSTLAELLPGATLLEGLHVEDSNVVESAAAIQAWLDGLALE